MLSRVVFAWWDIDEIRFLNIGILNQIEIDLEYAGIFAR